METKDRRITIVVDNHHYVLADISTLVANAGINIEDLDASAVNDFGVIHLSVDKYDEALSLLREASYQVFPSDAMVVRVEDKPGALAKVAVAFKDAEIDIRSIRHIKRDAGFCLISIVCERMDEARKLMQPYLVG